MPCGLLGRDVDDDDIGQFLDGDGAGDGGADIAGSANDCDFAIHLAPADFPIRSRGPLLTLARSLDCALHHSIITSANSDVFSSVAPAIRRARS